MNKNIVDEFSVLLNDKHISDIRIVSHDCIYVILRKFTDTESFPNFNLYYVLGMPLVNTKNEPYLFIRKLPKKSNSCIS